MLKLFESIQVLKLLAIMKIHGHSAANRKNRGNHMEGTAANKTKQNKTSALQNHSILKLLSALTPSKSPKDPKQLMKDNQQNATTKEIKKGSESSCKFYPKHLTLVWPKWAVNPP